jgi:D-amino-acid dehydrogenase
MKIVVVGGGIMGASVAYHLAREGAEVIVVERGDPGRATSAGAGIICPWIRRERSAHYYAIARRAAAYHAELVPALAEDGEADLGYRRVGAMLLSSDPSVLATAEALVRSRVADAPELGAISLLEPAEVQELFPTVRRDISALHVSGGARLDGRFMAQALERASVRLGAVWRRGDAALVVAGGRIAGVGVGSATIGADAVVLAAGAWAPDLLKPHGVDLPVAPQRGQIIHLGLPGVDTSAWPVLLPAETDHYLLAFDDSRVVVGATRETGSGFDYRVTAGGQKEVLDEALRVAPGLASATMIETRIGFRPMSPTGDPLLGKVAGIDGLFVGNGLGPSGLTLGPYAARLLAQYVTTGTPSPLIAPFQF